jgi:hypothetical protein
MQFNCPKAYVIVIGSDKNVWVELMSHLPFKRLHLYTVIITDYKLIITCVHQCLKVVRHKFEASRIRCVCNFQHINNLFEQHL